MQKKKSASSGKSDKAEKNSFDQLVKKITELTVQWAGPKEKRKDAKALKYELWCSICHNQGHTKEDCRLPTANTTANTHWIGESSSAAAEDYYAEGADGHMGHYANECPNPRQQQGYIPLCQNCHEPGHVSQ
ncbi:hypothetical protein R1sor_009015 [Riccia sorocarpa]|uniref:CCHC-type domain-containing protein n=1 Tax=Riccia sorocarpa TaxID=122646 RepID=A0ABD3H8K8_9MARC